MYVHAGTIDYFAHAAKRMIEDIQGITLDHHFVPFIKKLISTAQNLIQFELTNDFTKQWTSDEYYNSFQKYYLFLSKQKEEFEMSVFDEHEIGNCMPVTELESFFRTLFILASCRSVNVYELCTFAMMTDHSAGVLPRDRLFIPSAYMTVLNTTLQNLNPSPMPIVNPSDWNAHCTLLMNESSFLKIQPSKIRAEKRASKYNALHLAVIRGDMAQVNRFSTKKYLIDRANLADESFTPLLLAVKYGHLEIFKKLVKAGANTERKTKMGLNILHLAAKYGHYDLFKYICEHYQMSLQVRDKEGHTPLYHVMINMKNEPEAPLPVISPESKEFKKYSKQILKLDNRNNIIDYLLNYGGNFSRNDLTALNHDYKDSLLSIAIQHDLEIIALMILDEPNADFQSSNYFLCTPAHYAATKMQIAVIKRLHAKGADFTRLNIWDESVIDILRKKGLNDLLRTLGIGQEGTQKPFFLTGPPTLRRVGNEMNLAVALNLPEQGNQNNLGSLQPF